MLNIEKWYNFCTEENKVEYVPTTTTYIDDEDLQGEVECVVNELESRHLDPCPHYDEWYRCARALQDGLGEAGFSYFQRVSQLWSRGTPDNNEISRKWEQVRGLDRIHINTFFYLAQQVGIDLYDYKLQKLR